MQRTKKKNKKKTEREKYVSMSTNCTSYAIEAQTVARHNQIQSKQIYTDRTYSINHNSSATGTCERQNTNINNIHTAALLHGHTSPLTMSQQQSLTRTA